MRTETTNITCNVTDHKWIMKDVPGLKMEKYTSTLRNHIARLQFQLSGYKDPIVPKRIMATWPEAIRDMRENENFGRLILAVNGWLDDVLKEINVNTGTEEEKAKKIYAYVRDNFACDNHNAIRAQNNLKTVFKNKKGSVAEINLLLIAMLKNAGITADPVLLSTKDHGYAPAMYPLMDRYNYVICRVVYGGKTVLLDASHPRLGFGKLPAKCYNGAARVINEAGDVVSLEADSLKESRLTFALLSNNGKGKWVGNVKRNAGYYESAEIREEVTSKGKDAYFKEAQKAFSLNVKFDRHKIDSLQLYEVPVKVEYNFEVDNEDAEILYVNPLFCESKKENPFKAAERFYPVEMPYTTDETYILTMDVPQGYTVDELPKPIRLKMNEEGDAIFEYLISHSGNTVSLRTRLTVSRTFFVPDEYPMLREFFNLIVNKQNEQIVFKKKK